MILFTDLSEVLIRGIYGIEDRIDHVYDTDAAIRFAERKHEMLEQFEYLMRGCMTENQFWQKFLECDKWPFGVTEIKALLSQHFVETIPGTIKVYSSITSYPDHCESKKHKSIPMGRNEGQPEIWLVSDHIAERQEELEYLHPDVFNLVSRRIWSYDEVALKKDVAFFHRLLKKNDLKSDEVIFIDDYPDNTAAASKAGITSIWFRNSWQLKHQLVKYGFRFTKPGNPIT